MLTIQGITRSFDGQPVLKGIDLEVSQGEILCLLGPSGCGKTTLLRIIAGLEQADGGDVLLNEQSIMAVPVHQRSFGLMFQDFALFPHLNVAGNIAFGLKMQGLSPADQQHRIQEILQTVNLVGFEKRDVAQLSGGERQRVALARSLAPNPGLLMLDEPLGSLDAALREQLVVELRGIIKRLGLTAVYVTHDQHEAFAIADRIALMNAGILQQANKPEIIYNHPTTAFAARFLGLHNVYPVLSRDGETVITAVGSFSVTQSARFILLHPDYLMSDLTPNAESINGVIAECVFMGDSYRVRIQHSSGESLTVKLPNSNDHTPHIGETLSVQVPPQAVIPLSN
jgi:ABC-type Fe3+/spermidine/putrescine transport system ATPase subunit